MPVETPDLIAATLTPLNGNGDLNLDAVGPLVDNLLADGVRGLYVNGSTGEGVSLSVQERMELAAEYVRCVNQRVAVFIQVGHNSLREAQRLAAHAHQIQATGISATCPSYFKVDSISGLIACMQEIASAAPSLPFYYYHIPGLTGSVLSMPHFLEQASVCIDSLAGLKFTSPELHTFQECCQVLPERLRVFWGTDEMLLPALTVGAQAAIGSTYNVACPLYLEMVSALNSGEMESARALQLQAIRMIRVLQRFPFQASLKCLVARRLEPRVADIENCRLPLASLSGQQKAALIQELEAIGFPV